MSRKGMAKGLSTADDAPRCPWCSATLASAGEARCPSCGAALREDSGGEIPGVTQVDRGAIVRDRGSTTRSRGLIGWLAGDDDKRKAAVAPAAPAAGFARPEEAVRREMLRLELAALEAEAQARRAEAEAELAEVAAELAQRAGESGPGESGPGEGGPSEGAAADGIRDDRVPDSALDEPPPPQP